MCINVCRPGLLYCKQWLSRVFALEKFLQFQDCRFQLFSLFLSIGKPNHMLLSPPACAFTPTLYMTLQGSGWDCTEVLGTQGKIWNCLKKITMALKERKGLRVRGPSPVGSLPSTWGWLVVEHFQSCLSLSSSPATGGSNLAPTSGPSAWQVASGLVWWCHRQWDLGPARLSKLLRVFIENRCQASVALRPCAPGRSASHSNLA